MLSQPAISLSVNEKVRYVVMSQEHYYYLRTCEPEAAVAESKANLTDGRFVQETVSQHIKLLERINKSI